MKGVLTSVHIRCTQVGFLGSIKAQLYFNRETSTTYDLFEIPQ